MARYQVRIIIAAALASSVGLFLFGIDLFPQVGWFPSKYALSLSSSSLRGTDASVYYQSLADESAIPESRYVKGVAGFNYFDNLYVYKDTFCFVTSRPDDIGLPEQGAHFVTTGNHNVVGNTKGRATPPDENRWRVLTPADAHKLFGPMAIRNPGTTMWFNDEDGTVGENKYITFLSHYYHYVGEMLLGGWRLIVSASGNLELPARIVLRAKAGTWRDGPHIIAWLHQTVLAGVVIEEGDAVDDKKHSGQAHLYEHIAILDRYAAHYHSQNTVRWHKAQADTVDLEVPVNWMDPLRDRVIAMTTASGCSTLRRKYDLPVVTYVNRQSTGRRLVDADHEALVEALEDLSKQGVIEFNNVKMEHIPQVEQFCLAARTDIMLGVHGNGLSHMLWMKPGGGVLEFMYEGGFARDYPILAEFMAHEYYAIHNDHYFPVEQWLKPTGWAVDQGKHFHSTKIRVDAEYVAGLVEDMAKRRRKGPTPVHWKVPSPATSTA